MEFLDIDFETKSDVDLKRHGLALYASDPSTKMICMGWAIDGADPDIWWAGEPIPKELKAALESDIPVYAHNADFERHIFDYVMAEDYGVHVKLERWRCTMIMALAHGLPAALGELAIALGLPVQKQPHGARLIREYCGPRRLAEWKEGDRELMGDYCLHDVMVQQAARKAMRELSYKEWSEYHLTCRMNDQGIPVDIEFAEAALEYADDIAEDVDRRIAEITGGVMTKHTERKARDEWILPRLTDAHKKILEVWKKGQRKYSFDEEHRNALLEVEDLDPAAASLLEAINDAGSSALKKFAAAVDQNVDGWVHNTFVFHGAGTGRFSGRGMQPHNFRRDAFDGDRAEALICDIKEGYEVEKPSSTMARLLRPMIHHPDGIYYVDWSSIEGRVAPWIANNEYADAKLELYRQDKDVYIETAAGMFDLNAVEIAEQVEAGDKAAKNYRQSGKVAELSLQYAGGRGALQGMAKNYGMSFEDDEASRLVQLWRAANPWATSIWQEFDDAIWQAVSQKDTPFKAGRCTFLSDGVYLWCALPSGRFLAYFAPRMEDYETPWGEVRFGPTFQTSTRVKVDERKEKGEFYRNHLRGGLAFQNATQAVAADILRDSLLKADTGGLNIIGHVHDEIIGLGPESDGHKLNEIMLSPEPWADGIPIGTGGVEWGTRYGK